MLVTRVLNQCHRFPGFVYEPARFCDDGQSILIPIRPRKGSRATCSGCHRPAAGYDKFRTPRHFEFMAIRGFLVYFLYSMRRVNCKRCGIVVEEVPWGMGKHSLTKVYMHFPEHWARKLSWKETAESFHTTGDKVHDSVEYLEPVPFPGFFETQISPIEKTGVTNEREPLRGRISCTT